ncbi:LysR substrate-binding domain-containing protein [Sneathiella marina]|uniref:LysR substrate-binding domain-containing protein n=1 Tax=Sneathiella marina TaxID=2950108 RepID=A0ABY4W753_9PROT|nr:LysR substrate-binding domain-containing protein [Sneathiella marina]USG61585.1 LysR substrate-binding domain-containing protein [Sneathiella marina]
MACFKPSPRQLEYLVAVSKTGSFSKAARLCHVSQPTLSTQIQLLESQLQVTLIERSRSGACPTPIGLKVIDQSKSILADLSHLMNTVAHTSGNLDNKIKLGVGPTFGPYFLPYLLPSLNTKDFGLEILITEGSWEDMQEGLLKGELDCALTSPFEELIHLEYEEIIAEPMWIGIPVDHEFARCDRLLPEMLKGQKFFGLADDYTYYQTKLQEFCDFVGASIHEEYVGANLDAIRQLVSIGKGLSFFPEYYVASEFTKEGRVALRQISGVSLSRSIGLIWRQDSPRQLHFQKLLDACKGSLMDCRELSERQIA